MCGGRLSPVTANYLSTSGKFGTAIATHNHGVVFFQSLKPHTEFKHLKPTPFIRGRAEFLNFGRQTKKTRITSHGHIRHSIRTFLGLYLTPRNQRQGIVEAEKGEDHECQTCPIHLKKVLLARRL